MRRSTVLLVMLITLLLQSVLLAPVGSAVNVLADVDPVSLHWQQTGHHHHAHGSYHLDDSNESAQHLLSDHISSAAALTVTFSHDFPPLGSAAPSGLHKTLLPNPTLEGLLRPPRFRS